MKRCIVWPLLSVASSPSSTRRCVVVWGSEGEFSSNKNWGKTGWSSRVYPIASREGWSVVNDIIEATNGMRIDGITLDDVIR